MNKKAIEKLFKLAYTDSMTGVKNRNAFDEMREQMYKNGGNLDRLCAITVIFEDFDMISKVYGNSTCDDAIRTTAHCIVEILGEKADIYRTAKDEFMCISRKNLYLFPPSKNGHRKAKKNGMNRSLSFVFEIRPHLFHGSLDNEPLPT